MSSPAIKHVHVLGAGGFIGSNLVSFLLSKGHSVFGHKSLESLELWTKEAPISDLNGSRIVWLIGKITPFSAENDNWLVDLEISFIESYINNSNFQYFPVTLISSGGCVYSSKNSTYAKETDIAEGVNKYGQAKIQIEKRFLNSSISGNILRLGNVYGESAIPRHGQGVLAHWVDNYNKDLPLKLYGNPDLKRDYIHISDVCAAIEASLNLPQDSSIYNVGTGRGVTLRELLSIFEIVFSKHIEVEMLPGRPEDNFSYSLDISKIASETRWKPKISIEDGLQLLSLSMGSGNKNASN